MVLRWRSPPRRILFLLLGLLVISCSADSVDPDDGSIGDDETATVASQDPGSPEPPMPSNGILQDSVDPSTLAPNCETEDCCPDGIPVLLGDSGPNMLSGGSSAQCIVGLAGEDHLEAGSAGDTVLGGPDADTISGDSAADVLSGGGGADEIDAIVLTAEHCLASGQQAYFDYLKGSPAADVDFDGTWMWPLSQTWVQFHYRNLECNAGLAELPEFYQTLTYPVEEVVYHDHEADIGLLRIDGQPDPMCVTYNGFDARQSLPTPSSTAGIRHPGGRVAQLDVDGTIPQLAPYEDDDPQIEANFTLQAVEPFWERRLAGSGDIGWIRGGSSGGPLFNPQLRVIGYASGFLDGNPENTCGNPGIRFFDGRLNGAFEVSDLFFTGPEEPNRLQYQLGDNQRDIAFLTESDPFPLSNFNPTPCVGKQVNYFVNPYTADDVLVDWQTDHAPGQIIGVGYGELTEHPGHFFVFSMNIAELNPGGTEPPITIRVTTSFPSPHEDNCPALVREIQVQPIKCI